MPSRQSVRWAAWIKCFETNTPFFVKNVHSDPTALYYDLNLFDNYAFFVEETATVCPRSNDQFYVVTYYMNGSLLLGHIVPK